MPIVKKKLTLDEIKTLFEQYKDIDSIIKAFYKGCAENMPHANIDVIYRNDDTRLEATGHYIKPCNTKECPVPNSIKDIKIYEALMFTRTDKDTDFDLHGIAICIRKPGCELYYETNTTIPDAIHNAYGIDLDKIERLRYNICV